MVVLTFIVAGMMLVIFQASINLIYPLEAANPDLYFILVAYLAYRLDLFRSMVILFPVSWMLDIVSGIFLGFYPLLCFGGYFLLKIVADQLPVRTSYYQVPFVGICYLLISWLLYILISFFSPDALAGGSWSKILVRALLVIFFTPPFFRFFDTVRNAVADHGTKRKLFKMRTGNRYR